MNRITCFMGEVVRNVREVLGVDVSRGAVRVELARLDLLGRAFTPEDYLEALGRELGVEIALKDYPDCGQGMVSGEAPPEDVLGEVNYDESNGRVIILVRESLKRRPWPAYELCVLHEGSHLAAGHHLRRDKLRMRPLGEGATGSPEIRKLAKYEDEARIRAKWLLLASMAPEAFENEGINRIL